jgi:hypothetical protein
MVRVEGSSTHDGAGRATSAKRNGSADGYYITEDDCAERNEKALRQATQKCGRRMQNAVRENRATREF